MKNFDKLYFKKIDNVALSSLEDEAILLNLSSGTYFKLNSVGSFVIEKISEFKNFEEIINSVSEAFDIDYNDCENDIKSFLLNLKKRELIEIKEKS
tara:strand:+ start:420 stop:707 length:288 start_codon:yes stop_codon:yes gene_type:complete